MDEKKEIEKIYSLSPMQQGMLFYWLIHKDADIGNDPYYRCSTFIIKGKLDIPLFEKSFNLLIRRYDVLRTIFVYEKIQKPKQVVLKKVQAVINFEDLSGLNMGAMELEQYLSGKKEEDKQIGFDLGLGLLLRVSIFKTAGDNYVLVWSYHHIIMDGWCLGILYSEVMSIYSGLRSGTQAILPPVHAYRDYIKWIESYDKEKSLEYWKDYLEGFEVKTGFPWGKGQGKDDKYVHGEFLFPIERSYTRSLARLSEEYQVTVGAVFQTLWGVLLQKLNNTDDVVYGTVVSGRPPEVEGIERMVGLFINTTPFRLHAGGESSFVDCLKEVHREDILKKMKEYIPLVEILDLSPLKRNLFDHIMVFQNYPIQDAVSKSESGSQLGFTVENVESVEQTNYNFFLTIAPAEVFLIKFVFNAWLYDRGDIEKMGSYFLELVKQVVETVGIRIKGISILPEKEKERLLYELNNINPGDTLGEGYRCDKSIHQLFAGQVERIPDNIAVIGISTSEIKNLRSGIQESSFQVTYRELDYQSGRLSCILREKGVEADTIAAIKIERSVEMIIGIMGILKAGGAYLPIDSNYPQERINYMIKDSNAKVLIRNKSEIRNPKFETNPNVQKINDQNKHIEDLTVLNFENLNLNSIKGCPRRGLSDFEFPVSDLNSANLAYVIYTSGTTGKPKGAAIEHRSLVNRLNWMQKKYPIDNNDTILQKTTFTFDVSVWEISWWSIVGAKLCLLDPGGEKDPQIITQTIEKHNVTTMHFVPSMLSVFLDYLKTSGHAKKLARLKYVIASGEALLPAHVRRFNELLKKENGAKLANLYGPTEATIDVSYFDCLEVSEIIPIGKPIDNIGLYILDKYLNIQPAEIPGELCISGIGLARGYLNRPELTAERFLSVPALFPATKKIYKTGDLARWLPNGNIEFLGRIDHQIKIRGFRVELEEIENRLANHPGIKEAVVLAREEREGDKYLCAYIVSGREYSSSELREYLLQELPDYMIPAYFVTLASIPLTSNGKVDRKNLPRPEKQSIGTGAEYTPPVSETEKKLVRIWQNILSMEKIGIKDNFFDAGGDSIKIIGAVNLINKEFNSNIKTAAVYANNTIEKIAALIDSPDNGVERGALKKIEQELDVLKQHVFNEMKDPGLVEDVYPMSDVEIGMVYHTIKNINSAVYHDQFVYQLKYPGFEVDLFKRAVKLLTEKHPILRTGFAIEDFEEPVQIVYKQISLPVNHYDISHLEKKKQENYLELFIQQDRQSPFNPSFPPLWRMMIFLLGNNNICILLIFHHSIMDGWSVASLMTELNNTYLKLKSAPTFVPQKLKSSYRDFVLEQLTEKKKIEVAEYWRSELEDYKRLDISGLTGGKSNQVTQSERNIGFDKLEKLREVSRNCGTQIKNLFFAVYLYMLNMLSFENDIVTGLVTNNRPACEDGDKIIGCFLNTPPFRIRIPGGIKWSQFIRMVDEKTVALKKFENISLFEIARIIGEKTGEQNPVFDTMYNYIDFYVYRQADRDGVEVKKDEWLAVGGYENTNAIFVFNASMTLGGLSVILSYSGETFDNNLEKRLWNYFDNILDKIISEPDGVIVKNDLIPGEEKRRLLEEFNDTGNQYPKEKTIHELFEEQVVRTPGNIALIEVGKTQDSRRLTYKELAEKSGNIAVYLRSSGVGPDNIVAIAMERSIEMIVGILGILKAGGAYLPIDPGSPQERIDYMLKDSGAKMLIQRAEERKSGRAEFAYSCFSPASTLPRFLASNSSNLAYVIYTSGSTGNPKGVLIEHHSVINRLNWMQRFYPLDEEDIILQKTPYTFDVSVWELFWWGFQGARLCLLAPGDEKNAEVIVQAIEKYRVTTMHFVPSMLNAFLEFLEETGEENKLSSLKRVFASGEALLPLQVTGFQNLLNGTSNTRLINLYGPTEATVDVTYYNCPPGESLRTVPIGKPIDNIKLYIVDRFLNLSTIGVAGELCISGVGLARGYLNRQELTAEKFKSVVISHSSLAVSSSKNLTNDQCPMTTIVRLYKTGDLARWLTDGNIEFLGRIDQQVKIRGFRIELGEIEGRLMLNEGIGNAVVVAKSNENGDKYLCAYITPSGNLGKHLSTQALRTFLSAALPEYMVPGYFVFLETLPLTPSGKVDRKVLPAPAIGGEGADFIAPVNEIEKKLVQIWAGVLGLPIDKISTGSNFFELGGHSLRAIKVIAEIHKKLSVKISLSELFKLSTIKAISEFTRGAKRDIYKPIHPSEQKEYYPLTSAQKRMYIVEQITKDLSYNMPTVARLEGIVDKDKLEWAFLKLIERHEGFRTSFEIIEDKLVQVVHPMSRISFNIDFHETDEAGARERVNHFIRLFDMGKAPLLRVQLIKVGETHYVFMMDMHHIINDGISTAIMFEELGRLLSNEQLPEMKLQYKDYSEWQNGEDQLLAVKKQEDFWLNELGGELPVLNLPLDFPRPTVQNFEADVVDFLIDGEETARLSKIVVEEKATLYIVLLSIFNILLAKLSGQEDILLGTPLGGRRHPDLDRIIGMFVDTLVLRNYPSGEKTFRAFLNEVKDRTFNAFENQQFEFDELVSRLGVERDISRNPIFDVMFQWENADERESTGTQSRAIDFTVLPYADYANLLAKFDLALYAEKGRDTLNLTIRYCLKLFKKETIERLSIYLEKIVAEVAKNPGVKLSEIEILPRDEKKRILLEFNNTGHEYPKDKTIHQLFTAQVERAPDNMAVVLPSIDQITYRELEKKSNGLAALLRENGVEPGTIVGILVGRSIEMVIGLLGILKAGGGYLPLNPRQPEARTQFMMKDSGAKILLKKSEIQNPKFETNSNETNTNTQNKNQYFGAVSVLDFEHLNFDIVSNFDIRASNLNPLNLAYLIYTSGSTGNPKGAPIAHSNFSPLVHWGYRVMAISGADRFLQNLSYFFDWSVWEIFLALTTGAGLYVTGEEVLLSGEALSNFMCENKITVLHITPSQFQILAGVEVDGKSAKLESLKHLCFGAEKLTYDLVKRSIDMIPGDCRIYNMYGPTEATIIASVLEINRNTPDKYEKYGSVPIGSPVGNTQLYVLDKYFNICPLNVAGELYIGGDRLSKGYVNNPELTAEKFIDFHHSSFIIHHSILYRTGDLARWLPDGEVEFLGRRDYQVKIRGRRIELGEIENKCLEHEGVKVAVATVKGETDLCAYIVPKVHIGDEAGFKAELKEYLLGRLPGYMIPSFIVLITSITLTPNGKVDLRALPQPELVSLEEYFAPRDVVEEKLVKIWVDVLGKDPVKDRIGIDDSFFEVGGHSLKATILAAKLHKEFGVKVPLAEIFKAPRIRKLAEYIKSEGKDAYISIEPAEKKEYYLLSPAQKRLYVLQHMLIDNISYNIPNVIPLLGNIEKEKLEATFKKLIERHESLRTSFITINGEPVQRIHEKVDFTIGWYEIAGEPEADDLITGFTRPFDISLTPLLRVNHVTIGSSRRVLFIDMHHIITDGVSQSILEKEFVVLYAGGELPPLRLQYKDYALWQNSAVQHTLIKEQETYWLNMFADEIPALDIPFDYPRPAIQGFEGNSVEFPLSYEENQTLKILAKEAAATLYMSILSVFTILLAKLSGQEDIIVGTAIAGRRHDDLEQIIGMFVNTLALRNYPVGEKNFPGFLQELKARTLGAFENQEYQFEELVEKISVSRDAGRNPLFDVMYNFLNRDEYPDRGKTRESRDPVSYTHRKGTSKFDLALEVVDLGERLALTFNYCTKLFTPATIERFISYFKNLLNLLSGNPRQKLSQLEIIGEQEKRRILYDFNDTEAGYPGDKTIHRLFEEQAEAIPDHIALVGLGHGAPGMGTREHHLAYRGLNEKASLLGCLLGQKGVKTDAIVGIIAERSVETIVGILGVLKAGGAYMPIDPNSPGERRRYMMADSSAGILLTAGDVLSLSTREARFHHSAFSIHHSNNLAYIIYTSGTSGAPKGVMVEHRNVINLVEALNREIYISYHKALNICLIAPYIFDASVKQVFVSLLLGHRLYIAPGESRLNGEYLLDYCRKYHIEISDGTPAHLRLILENIKQYPAFPPVKQFIIGGEALKWDTVEEFLGRIGEGHLKISNIYGPTECTVDSSVYQINRLPDRRLTDIPIGRPLSNCRLYIVDKAGRLQPIGIPGELCISGAGVSRGYLNQPAVTAEKFRVNPFPSPSPGTGKNRGLHRMYYSGDLARWEADGNIQFLGRIDRQVKIRGYRIELGEIENRLLTHPGITGALVLVREDHAGDRYLCAYIVCNKGADFPGFAILKNELKDYLSRSLPEYMIPGYITEVEAIPLTPSGKIDWRKLPGPVVKGEEGYHAPRDFTEKKLVELWVEVLGRDPLQETIGIDDNFFNLGGHSLKATILASQIQKEFEVKLPLVEIFRAPRIREMGEYIKSMVKSKYVSIEPAEERKYYALSSAQERLYVLQQISFDSTSYNMPYVIPLPGDIDMAKLESTFKALIARHESLRTSFALKNEEPVQLIHRDVHFSIGNYEAAIDEELEKIMAEFVRPFDLSGAPLLRVNLLARGPRRRDLLIDMHHIITDGISQEILRKEFMALYGGEQLTPLRLQYKDYSQWQNSQIEKERLKQQESYWLNEFAGDIPVLELPTDYLRPLIQAFDGDAVNIEIPGEETHALIALGLAGSATPFMVLAAMFNILLAKLSGREDIIIGTPIAGRRHADLEKIIGMFVNTLVLRNYPIGQQTFREFLKEVRERSLEAFENQEYPFEELVEKVGVNRDTGRNPLFDVMFSMQNVENISAGARVDGEREQAEKGDDLENIFQTAKFDLTLTVVDVGAGPDRRWLFSFQYCTKLFKKETIQRFARYFKNTASIIIKDPGLKLKEIEVISEEEKELLLLDFNNTKAEYPGDKTIHRLFAEQVEKTPDIIALAGIGYGPKSMAARDQHLTYNDLNEKSNRLAHYLLKQGIVGNEMAAIMTERSLEMIIGILAILKAGGAYVPLDPKAPVSRGKYILDECAVSMALTLCAADDEKNSSLFENSKCIYINEESQYAGMSPAQPVCSAAAESLAYVIFTSGSTGKPKGVPITHANFSPLLHWGYRRLGISPKDRVIQNLSYYFDWSVWEIFITLTTGAGLHIVNEDVLLNPEACIAFMAKHQITALHVTPTQYRYLLNATWGPAALTYLFIGAEKLSCDLAKRSFASVGPGCRVFNMYGPTECTIIAAVLELERPADIKYNNLSGIPIGQSAANTHFLILDKYLKLSPVNTAGELYIGGIGVARGYLNRPELTAEKFIKNRSYRSYKTYILYKTGDLVRWLPDGNIEFLGRLDQQVKIRGYRIELGEIENRLLAYPGIKDAVVLALEEAPGDKYLCAYIVTDTGYEIAGLREYLSNELPDYMIPAHFVKLGKIPLTPNGKVDRKALPEPGFASEAGKYTAPRNEIERKLIDIWSEILALEKEKIGSAANFFQLGGHSLKATVMVSKIYSEFGVRVPLVEIFKNPTAGKIGEYLLKEKTNMPEKILSEHDARLVLLRKAADGKNGKHLFFIHDGTGEVEVYMEFCNRLNSEFNCWGIRADRMESLAPRNITIEELARNYIETIKKIQPNDHYYIAGWSLGGTIAFEIVAQLEQLKEKVSFLALIDSPPPYKKIWQEASQFDLESELRFLKDYAIPGKMKKKLKNMAGLAQFWLSAVEYLEASNFDVEMIKGAITGYGMQVLPNFQQLDIRESVYYLNVGRTLRNARALYTPPGKIHTPLHYIAAGESRNIPQKHWSDYCHGAITFSETTGDHYSILKMPAVEEFAKSFDAILSSFAAKA
ncbi:MAG: amino acid adenylation domain-containing protein [Candidatus Aminicenantes bacterium]|nr:amino acid adenylation domain-containing protein [Candidatus Aminicenantes bacterium]